MNYKYRPAPCLVTSDRTSVRKAIELMITRDTSYILVSDEKKRICGIVTKGDVFKNFHQLRDDNALDESILSIASSPVITTGVDLMHTAPSIMIRNRLRHLPIVESSESGGRKLVGMLTERSIFELMIRLKGLPDAIGGNRIGGGKERQVAVISPDGFTFDTLESFFKLPVDISGMILDLEKVWREKDASTEQKDV